MSTALDISAFQKHSNNVRTSLPFNILCLNKQASQLPLTDPRDTEVTQGH